MSWAVAGSHPGIQPQHMQQEEWRACGRAHLWAWASRGLCRSAHRRRPGCTSGGSPRPRPPRPTPTPSPGRKKRSRPPPCPLHEGSMAGGGGQGPKLATVAVRSASAGSQLPMCVAGWLAGLARGSASPTGGTRHLAAQYCLPACLPGGRVHRPLASTHVTLILGWWDRRGCPSGQCPAHWPQCHALPRPVG